MEGGVRTDDRGASGGIKVLRKYNGWQRNGPSITGKVRELCCTSVN
jgi:hypothetical protein